MKNGKRKVLVVEDEAILRRAVVHELGKKDYEVIEATDGEEGLRHLAKKPDFIWLDLYLPHVDGIEFLKKLKTTPHAKIPVLIVSVSKNRAEVAKSIHGLNLVGIYIKSDSSLSEIVAQISKVLEAKK